MEPFTREWLVNGRILCYRFHDANHENADAWYHDIAALLRDWSDERPLLLLLDMQLHARLIGSYALMRSRQVGNMRPDVKGRTAVVVSNPLLAQVISAFIRSGVGTLKRQRKLFSDEPSAIAWLLDNDVSSPDDEATHSLHDNGTL